MPAGKFKSSKHPTIAGEYLFRWTFADKSGVVECLCKNGEKDWEIHHPDHGLVFQDKTKKKCQEWFENWCGADAASEQLEEQGEEWAVAPGHESDPEPIGSPQITADVNLLINVTRWMTPFALSQGATTENIAKMEEACARLSGTFPAT